MPKAIDQERVLHPEVFDTSYLANHFIVGADVDFWRAQMKRKDDPLPHVRISERKTFHIAEEVIEWFKRRRAREQTSTADAVAAEMIRRMAARN